MRLHVLAQVQRQTGKPGQGQTPRRLATHQRRETSHLRGLREILTGAAPRVIWTVPGPVPEADIAAGPGSEAASEVVAVWGAPMAVAEDITKKQHLTWRSIVYLFIAAQLAFDP
jgi:hypothetical protein